MGKPAAFFADVEVMLELGDWKKEMLMTSNRIESADEPFGYEGNKYKNVSYRGCGDAITLS